MKSHSNRIYILLYLVRVALRILAEALLATRSAKIIGAALVLALLHGLLCIHLHSADRVCDFLRSLERQRCLLRDDVFIGLNGCLAMHNAVRDRAKPLSGQLLDCLQ